MIEWFEYFMLFEVHSVNKKCLGHFGTTISHSFVLVNEPSFLFLLLALGRISGKLANNEEKCPKSKVCQRLALDSIISANILPYNAVLHFTNEDFQIVITIHDEKMQMKKSEKDPIIKTDEKCFLFEKNFSWFWHTLQLTQLKLGTSKTSTMNSRDWERESE